MKKGKIDFTPKVRASWCL